MSAFPHAHGPGRFAPPGGHLRFGEESPAADGTVRWLLKRNCSLAPRQLLVFYLSLCLLSLSIAGIFWLQGATLVLPFAWVEVLAVGIALVVYARHAADREAIHLRPGFLVVECVHGPYIEQVEFASAWVRVEPESEDRSLIELSGQGRRISIGRFVRPELRRQLADELRWAIRRWQARPPQVEAGPDVTSEKPN